MSSFDSGSAHEDGRLQLITTGNVAPKLCNSCQNRDCLGKLTDLYTARARGTVRIHKTWEKLGLSATNCDFCSLLRYSVLKSWRYNGKHPGPGAVVLQMRQPKEVYSRREFELRVGDNLFTVFYNWAADGRPRWPSEGTPPRADVDEQLLGPLIAQWLKTCTLTHRQCRHLILTSSTEPQPIAQTANIRAPKPHCFAPTRLLQISPDGTSLTLKLVLSSDILARRVKDETPSDQNSRHTWIDYIALSYVWGDSRREFVTTSHNIACHLVNIDFSSLPRTIQDAVRLTHNLGVSFLWIDALCIVQPSEEDSSDWEVESSMMKEIYSNSLLCILAESGLSVDYGLFAKRPVFEFGLRAVSIADGSFTFFPEIPSFSASVDQSPLNQRGWTFQERLLPGRTVHISQHGVFWNCAELAAWEFDHKGRAVGPQLSTYDSAVHMYRRWKLGQEEQEEDRVEKMRQTWTGLCKQYSTRRFSIPVDKLPALSGIARLFHAKYYAHAQYLAGLWSTDLPGALAWHTVFSPRSKASHVSESGSTRIPGLPTWSWTSVQTKIETPFHAYLKTSGGYCAQLMTATIQPATQDPYGHVNRGVLRMKGRFKLLKLRTRGFTGLLNEAKGVFTKVIGGEEYGENDDNAIYIDELKHWNAMRKMPTTEVLLPAFFLFENRAGHKWFILLLERSADVGQVNEYRRIGLYVTASTEYADPSLKDGWEDIEINLV